MKGISTDWLGFDRVFYNTKNNRVSNNIRDVIDYNNVEFDAEGLNNYLDFGYSVFGLTPIKNVFYLRANETLNFDTGGNVFVKKNCDPCLDWLSLVTPEEEAWASLNGSIRDWANNNNGSKVLIPLSGGLDSRLLNYFYPYKENIISCTYGISKKQKESFEAVYAKEVATRLGINWKQIELGNFHSFMNEWDDLYGPLTHAHGMYQWEFFSLIYRQFGAMPMLSGIVGDAWAGGTVTSAPKCPDDLVGLGYPHKMTAESKYCLLKTEHYRRSSEFDEEVSLLQDERYRALYLVRTKMVLLTYLFAVPRAIGFTPFSPFLSQEVALRMLTVEPLKWRNRIWQYDFLAKQDLRLESDLQRGNRTNDLNYMAMSNVPLSPLNVELLRELFDIRYLEWINNNIDALRFSTSMLHAIMGIRFIGGALRRFGVSETIMKAYFAYLVLKPIEQVLLKRNEALQ